MIIKILKKYKEFINYFIFGVLTTLISIGLKYLLLFTILEASNAIELQTSIILSWFASVLFAYFANRIFVFASKNNNKLKEFIIFIITRLSTLLLEMFIMWFFITFLKLNSDLYVIIFTLISEIAVSTGNYIFCKLFVFKKADK